MTMELKVVQRHSRSASCKEKSEVLETLYIYTYIYIYIYIYIYVPNQNLYVFGLQIWVLPFSRGRSIDIHDIDGPGVLKEAQLFTGPGAPSRHFGNGPVEIVHLPINSMVVFHGCVNVYQRVSLFFFDHGSFGHVGNMMFDQASTKLGAFSCEFPKPGFDRWNKCE